MDRYSVFVDGGYARKVFDQFGSPRISYLRFSNHVAGNQERLRTYYYDCAPYVSSPPTEEERKRKAGFDRFKHALELQSRFQVRLGRLAIRGELSDGTPRFEQKMVDILLAVDLVQLAVGHQIQRAVILAKDSDFVPAIQIARNAGTVVELYYHTPPTPHAELMSACDDRISIDQSLIDDITL
jgi:uncharacterized LabA/DUF88 family protein